MSERRQHPRPIPDAPEDTERTLPRNLEAERAVLGAILLHNDAYVQTSTILQASDFFRVAHRRIYQTIAQVLDTPQGSIDLITLKDELAKRNELEEVGGPAYLGALLDGVPRSSNTPHYASVVREKSRLRALIYTGNVMMTKGYEAEESADQILHYADQAIVALQYGHAGGETRALAGCGGRLLERIEFNHAHRGELRGIDTGFASINEQTTGWLGGDLIILAARPSVGKTAFVLNTTTAAARTGKHVALFSLEMKQEQLELRILSALSGVPATKIAQGYLVDSEWGPLSHAIGEMDGMSIHINDTASMTAQDIRAACRRLRSEQRLDLVIIDYIQLMAGDTGRKGATRSEELGSISRRLKILAGELHVPMIVLSQLSRAGDQRTDTRPQLSDLRESGALEQDADLVCFLHRKNHREGGVTNFILGKQRNGPTGTVNLLFDRDIQRFTDAGEEPPPTPAEIQAEDAQAKTTAIKRHRARKYS